MRTITRMAIGCAGILGGQAALGDWNLNKDIVNIGGGAAGIRVEFNGTANVQGTFDGYEGGGSAPRGHFGSSSQSTSAGGNTEITWSGFDDGADSTIDTGQLVHVGWTLSENVSIARMYFVDANGDPIPGGTIENQTPLVEVHPLSIDLVWGNVGTGVILLNDPGFILPNPNGSVNFNLAELNMFNLSLNSQITPWLSGPVVLYPGQTFSLQLPWTLEPGDSLVMRFGMSGPQSAAQCIDYAQLVASNGPGECPLPGCEQADLDDDCTVGLNDLTAVLAEFGLVGTGLTGDLDHNGRVDLNDLASMLGAFGRICY